nr:disintegrin and metalloproteinase domain-containing protein 32 [Oryctolagus cuniculus]
MPEAQDTSRSVYAPALKAKEHISYSIPIDEKLYTVHLKQRYFLADNFMVYLYNQKSVSTHSTDIKPHCYYQGYIEGYPNSIVTLSTCSGLRGVLQFENVSYGIEPLESTVQFQHLLYKLGNRNKEFSSFNNDTKIIEKHSKDYIIYIGEKPILPVPDVFPLYLEMYIVVDKALDEYLGSDSTTVTNKIIEVFGLVNSMFTQFKVTVVLSSLELWSDENKISTIGEADELLHIFLKWKHFYLTLRPHDVASPSPAHSFRLETAVWIQDDNPDAKETSTRVELMVSTARRSCFKV